MKITKTGFWKENLLLKKPYTIAVHTIDSVENAFVLIELENGIKGIGAASPASFVTGESIGQTVQALELQLDRLLFDHDIRDINVLLRQAQHWLKHTPAALAAIDIALHDAFTQYLGIPLVRYLGAAHQYFPTSVTIGIKSVEESVAEAEEYLGLGFRIIKLKIGKSVEEDLQTFLKVREKVGTKGLVRVDANQGYDVEALQLFADRAGKHGVEFYEQPFPPGQLSFMRSLPESLRVTCAADEDLHDPEAAMQLSIPPLPYGIWNIKLMKCGGVNPAMKIAEMAQLNHIKLMWGCNDESIVSITAALHAALASPATRYIDLDGSFDLARDVVSGGFILKDGCMSVSDKPGLGVQLLN